MATATIGSNPASNDWIFDASMHQAWIGGYVVNSIGRMVQVHAYCAAASGGGTGGAVAWQNVNTAPLQTTSDSMAAGSGTSGAWHASFGDIPFAASDQWAFGFYASNGVWTIYHDDGGGTFVKASAISPASGGTNVSAYAGRAGSMPAYGTYFIIEFYQRVSGSWVKRFMDLKRGGANKNPQFNVRRSGSWTQVRLDDIPCDPFRPTPVAWRHRGGWEEGLIVFEGPFYIGSGREQHLWPRRFAADQIAA